MTRIELRRRRILVDGRPSLTLAGEIHYFRVPRAEWGDRLDRLTPVAVRSEITAQQCRLLVEMLADDAARRLTGPLPLGRALVALAGAPKPAWDLGATG